MKNKKKYDPVFYVLFVMLATVSIPIRFTHPEMTETQLFLEFWPVWAACFLIVAGIAWAIERYE